MSKGQTNNHKTYETMKPYITILIGVLIFLLLYFLLPETFNNEARLMTSIVAFGVYLWAFEPIPMGMTALIILTLMLLFHAAEIEIVFSGFASPATHLIIAGMLIAKAVNGTPLVKRVTYVILKRWGGTSKGLLGSLILIEQIQAIFIPSTAVRTTLVLPVSSMIIETVGAKRGSNLRKMIMLGVAFAGNISGTAIMTAAIGNILTVELLNHYNILNVTYFDWFFITFPLWIILVPSIWFMLLKLFPLPKNERNFPMLKGEMEKNLESLGPLNLQEIKCMIILFFIVILWMTQSLHGYHPSVPAMIGAILMTLPGIGIASWHEVIKINFNTILLIGVALSIGYGLIDSGAVNLIGEYLSFDWLLHIIKIPIIGIIIIVILTQVLHKLVPNVSASVVTVVPMTISVAINAGIDPLAMAFTAGFTSLYGFLLAVETMPNIIVHGSGLIDQKDFLKPGIYATAITFITTIFIAATWWKLIGFI